ncbi:short-chain dehydrogenase [Sphaerisporangium melleum]|uniref:Short-chain dehydrogenase n=1 Tax=Sphaerisporangium melleum TaxID=321316 RepID=A0A917VJR1_9ACTN|nr:glucose 1-dehydrogenase [Sphaerisporangium melleum]GGK87700.1 short-chain dehydrogenase [Sphaerisporangium melleum]GII72433.1 short-chain dehydrogenase [Sphaerisporangium melleum]
MRDDRAAAPGVFVPGGPSDPISLFRLDGRVAVVTGASSGLGARFAQVLTAAGARVALAARRKDRIGELAAQMPGALAVPCDVTAAGDRDRLVRTVTERLGSIDILVNNAGLSQVVPAEEQTPDAFSEIVAVNLNSVFALSAAVASGMLRRGGGSIVNVASVYGLVGSGSLPQAAYAASKGGVINLTRELAAQWADRGVRVNALCPGWFRSEMTAEMVDTGTGRAWIERRTPMRRLGEPHELDGALLFLAGAASTYVTGTAVPVDGGYLTL